MSNSSADALRARLARLVRQDGPIGPPTGGVGHVTFVVGELEATARFYAEVLGFPLVRVEASPDHPACTQIFVDVGGDSRLGFADFPSVEPGEGRRARGSVHHIALRIDEERLHRLIARLVDHGIPFDGPIRKAYTSVYVRDPDGLLVELLAGHRLPEGEP